MSCKCKGRLCKCGGAAGQNTTVSADKAEAVTDSPKRGATQREFDHDNWRTTRKAADDAVNQVRKRVRPNRK